MTKRNLLIAIPIVAVVLNGLGYLIYSKSRTPTTVSGTDTTGGRAAPQGVGSGAARPEGAAAERKATPEEDEAARESRAQARRASGLAALEAGEYDKALIHFTEAKALIGDKANVNDLLKVTEDLRKRPAGSAKPARAAAPPEPPPARKVATRSSGSSSRRSTPREEPDVESPPPPPPSSSPAGGLLIVTTTPRGMLVHVDDTPVDLTPMKTKVKPGTHRVALLDGDRKVYETTVDIKDGGTATLLRDLTAERAEASRPSTAAAVTPPPPREETRPPPATPPSTTPTNVATTTSRPAKQSETTTNIPSATGEMGTLEIASPGLYGVVWVNGRPRGYPPLAVRDLPAGPVKVEVRVNGVQKRVATAMVKAGLTTSIKLRSSEASQ